MKQLCIPFLDAPSEYELSKQLLDNLIANYESKYNTKLQVSRKRR